MPCWPRSTWSPASSRDGTFEFVRTDEDIHTAVERRVTAIAGPPGAKMHTGRSRNDQIATDVRLWAKRELREIARRVHRPPGGADRPRRRGRPRLPPRLHAPPAGAARAPRASPAGPRVGVRPRRRADRRRDRARRRVAARRRRAGRLLAAARPGRDGCRPRVRARLRQLARRGRSTAITSPRRCSR